MEELRGLNRNLCIYKAKVPPWYALEKGVAEFVTAKVRHLFGLCKVFERKIVQGERKPIYLINCFSKPQPISFKSDNLREYLTIENTGHLPNELTTETIKLPHRSYPQNPIIADVLYLTAFFESWGTGVSRMVDACKAGGLPEPEYGTDGGFVWITFRRPNSVTNSDTNTVTNSDINHDTI